MKTLRSVFTLLAFASLAVIGSRAADTASASAKPPFKLTVQLDWVAEAEAVSAARVPMTASEAKARNVKTERSVFMAELGRRRIINMELRNSEIRPEKHD